MLYGPFRYDQDSEVVKDARDLDVCKICGNDSFSVYVKGEALVNQLNKMQKIDQLIKILTKDL